MTPKRMLLAVGAVLVAINVLSAIWDASNDRKMVERSALRNFNNLTALLADHTARALESIDTLVRAGASNISAAGVGDPVARVERMRERISGIPQIRAILLLDGEGKLVLSTDERSQVGADYSAQAYFQRQRDGSANGRYVSGAFRGKVSNRWSFAISQPVRDPDGRFAGVLAGIVDIEYFDRLYRSLDIGDHAFVALLTNDGTLVTRVAPGEETVGAQPGASSDVVSAVAGEGRFSGWAPGSTGGGTALISAARVADAPLIVEVGAPASTVLSPWYAESLRILVRTLLTSAVMLALVALAARELARRALADRQMQEDRRLAEAEQQRLQLRLRQAEKMEAIGRLAGGIAHDFNNVLGGILGYGEMLLEGAAPASPEERYTRNLLIAANRARDLVDQILTYSRSQRAARVPVDLGRIVREALEVIRGSLPEGIALEPVLPAAPLVVMGDATQLHQVVMNLCTNAVHSMAGDGTLAVTLHAIDLEQELAVMQGVVAPGRYVKLVVSDTGTGMDGATLARIFEPFFTTKEVGKGTGLGLSLVYGIVTDSGGAAHVTSLLGHGSTFEIYLPRADVDDVAIEREAAPAARGHGERVLLVDDEEPLLVMTAEVLGRLGYEPVAFSDPHAALASFTAMPTAYDLMLTDETMPGLTGTELARAARAARPGLPIVLLSGFSSPPLMRTALEAGVDEVLRKPVQSRELAAALARALSSRGPGFT